MTLSPFKVQSSTVTEKQIVENSRKLYGRPRQVVEEEIERWSATAAQQVAAQGGERTGARPRPFGPPRERTQRPFAKPQRERYAAELAGLGIEFQERKGEERPPERRGGFRERGGAPPYRGPRPGPQPETRETAAEEQEEKKPAMSLSELKPVEKHEIKHERPEVNIDELRHAISESLSKVETEPRAEKAPPDPTPK